MTKFTRTGGGQGQKSRGEEGKWQKLLIHVCCQISTAPSSWHLKGENETDIRFSRQPFPPILGCRGHRLRTPHVWNIRRAFRGWVIRGRETVAKAGVCVCVYVRTGVCLHMCQHKRVSHRRMLAGADSHTNSANLWQRPSAAAAAHLFPSSSSKTTLLSLLSQMRIASSFPLNGHIYLFLMNLPPISGHLNQ